MKAAKEPATQFIKSNDELIKYYEDLIVQGNKRLKELAVNIEKAKKDKIAFSKKLKEDKNIRNMYQKVISLLEKSLKDDFVVNKNIEKNENKMSKEEKEVIAKFVIAEMNRRLENYNESEKILKELAAKKLNADEKEILTELQDLITKKDNISTAKKISAASHKVAYESFGLSSF